MVKTVSNNIGVHGATILIREAEYDFIGVSFRKVNYLSRETFVIN